MRITYASLPARDNYQPDRYLNAPLGTGYLAAYARSIRGGKDVHTLLPADPLAGASSETTGSGGGGGMTGFGRGGDVFQMDIEQSRSAGGGLRMLFEKPGHRLQCTRTHDGVRIQEQKKPSIGLCQTDIVRPGEALVPGVDRQPDPGEDSPHHIRTAVRRAIVHDVCFQRRRRSLLFQGAQAGLQEITCVQVDNDD